LVSAKKLVGARGYVSPDLTWGDGFGSFDEAMFYAPAVFLPSIALRGIC